MKTEIPKQDGWYWIDRPYRLAHMARVFTDGDGHLGVVVMSLKNPTGFMVHYDPY